MNLHELLLNPGSRLPFRCELSTDRLDFPAVLAYTAAPVGEGFIVNNAGALTLRGTLSASLRCVCDRCARPFERPYSVPLHAVLTTEVAEEEDEWTFLLEDDCADLDEIILTSFLFGLDMQLLCREDCAGLCPTCGKNHNDGPCGCVKESDPRLAALAQLLKKEKPD